MKPKELLALFILAALWGGSFIFIKILSPVLGPFLVVELRVLIAGIVLLMYSLIIKRSTNFKKYWKQYLVIGAFNTAIPFTLVATATLTLDASLASILNSTTPLFTAFVAWAWLKERFTLKKSIGIVFGILGVSILMGWNTVPFSYKLLGASMLSILATLSYALAGVYAKVTFKGMDSLSLSTGQQLAAALVMLPLTLFNLRPVVITSTIVFSVLGLALLCTAIAYLLYFFLINNVGPTKTLSVTFLIPMFGMLWGAVYLKEAITLGMIIGLVVILTSISLISMDKVKLKK